MGNQRQGRGEEGRVRPVEASGGEAVYGGGPFKEVAFDIVIGLLCFLGCCILFLG